MIVTICPFARLRSQRREWADNLLNKTVRYLFGDTAVVFICGELSELCITQQEKQRQLTHMYSKHTVQKGFVNGLTE